MKSRDGRALILGASSCARLMGTSSDVPLHLPTNAWDFQSALFPGFFAQFARQTSQNAYISADEHIGLGAALDGTALAAFVGKRSVAIRKRICIERALLPRHRTRFSKKSAL